MGIVTIPCKLWETFAMSQRHGNSQVSKLTIQVMWKSSNEKPNPLTPFPTSVGGRFKVSDATCFKSA
jgi:hypothetical protein